MHVDAFFEYLMDRPHPYWTEIPLETTPIAETGRDGVAAEDDMALRALLPQIKPRRGRRKPEDEETGKSPSQRPSPLHDEYPPSARPDASEPWSAHPDGRGSVFLFPSAPDPMRLNASMGQPPAPHWSSNDIAQTPLTAYPHPQSALTPITRNSFWADPSEPRSAITPSKPRSTSRRHGAKVVSSAWRSGGAGSTGKTRGRPPISRGGNPDGPFSAFPAISEVQTPTFKLPSPTPDKQISQSAITPSTRTNPSPGPSHTRLSTIPPPPAPSAPPVHILSQPSPTQENAQPRPAKRSRLSLQVPERVGGEVRLATPPLPLTAPPTAPPVVMVNGQAHENFSNNQNGSIHQHYQRQQQEKQQLQQQHQQQQTPSHADGVDGLFERHSRTPAAPTGTGGVPQVAFHDLTDRTHIEEVEEFFTHQILMADWSDVRGARVPTCSVDEAAGLAQTVVENLLRTAVTKEAFLINLSALVGGKMLMPRGALRVKRLETTVAEMADRSRYLCEWELRFGDIRGSYAMEETVLHAKWKKERKEGEADESRSTTAAPEEGEGQREEAERWQKMYKEITDVMQNRDEELLRLRRKVVECMRQAK